MTCLRGSSANKKGGIEAVPSFSTTESSRRVCQRLEDSCTDGGPTP